MLIVEDISDCCRTSYIDAMDLPVSFESIYFNSLAYEENKNKIKNKKDIDDRVFKYGNEIIKALKVLIKFI